MKKWQRALGDIRLLGPDGKRFREEVKFVYDYIENLEKGLLDVKLYSCWKEETDDVRRIREIARKALR